MFKVDLEDQGMVNTHDHEVISFTKGWEDIYCLPLFVPNDEMVFRL